MRDAKEYFDDIPNLKVAPDMLKLAEHILQSKAADFDPSQFVDHYEDAVVKMLKKKQAGLPVPREHATPRPQNVVNLMDALRRGIAQEKAAAPRGASALRDSARCCFPFRARRRKKPWQSRSNDQALVRKRLADFLKRARIRREKVNAAPFLLILQSERARDFYLAISSRSGCCAP